MLDVSDVSDISNILSRNSSISTRVDSDKQLMLKKIPLLFSENFLSPLSWYKSLDTILNIFWNIFISVIFLISYLSFFSYYNPFIIYIIFIFLNRVFIVYYKFKWKLYKL